MSAFESNKQRFFNHLHHRHEMPLARSAPLSADLAAGHSAVIQVVSTSEAVMERRLEDIPAFGLGRPLRSILRRGRYIMDYLDAQRFPTQLFRKPYDR